MDYKDTGLYAVYQSFVKGIIKEYCTEKKPELTEREMKIALLAAQELINGQISARLFISQNTVKTQLKNAFEKLGINSRALLKQYLVKEN